MIAHGPPKTSPYADCVKESDETICVNCFIAEVPELPGCAADGQTYSEALQNAEQIIDEWIETAHELGRNIPEPRGRLIYA